jgi:hypothetical protein
MDHGVGGDHLCVERRGSCQNAMKRTTMGGRPIHHGRNTELMRLIFHVFCWSISELDVLICDRTFDLCSAFFRAFPDCV